MRDRRSRLVTAGLVLGVGLGAFVDGIVLHQLLQWHDIMSSVRPPTDLVALKANMLWDGVFHAFAWLVTVLGVALLFRAAPTQEAPWSARRLVGAMLAGWGVFDVVEGVIDHQLLGLHHVHPGAHQLAWDLGFLIGGAALVAIGLALVTARR